MEKITNDAVMIASGFFMSVLLALTVAFWPEEADDPATVILEQERQRRLSTKWDVYRSDTYYIWYRTGQKPFPTKPPQRLVQKGVSLQEIQAKYMGIKPLPVSSTRKPRQPPS